MAHFAELDENNVVLRTIVVNNDVIDDLPFPESEPLGVALCKELFGDETKWVQTSINNNFRKQYGSTGWIYNAEADVFIPPKPLPSFVFDPDTLEWMPPIPIPEVGRYQWDENSLSWVELDMPKDWIPPNYVVV